MARFGETLLQLTDTYSRLQCLARWPSISGLAEVSWMQILPFLDRERK